MTTFAICKFTLIIKQLKQIMPIILNIQYSINYYFNINFDLFFSVSNLCYATPNATANQMSQIVRSLSVFTCFQNVVPAQRSTAF